MEWLSSIKQLLTILQKQIADYLANMDSTGTNFSRKDQLVLSFDYHKGNSLLMANNIPFADMEFDAFTSQYV